MYKRTTLKNKNIAGEKIKKTKIKVEIHPMLEE